MWAEIHRPEQFGEEKMRTVNCRFNPTLNGNLHLGHAYLCLVNEYEAHSRGGKFLVRFDDNQEKQCDDMSWGDREIIRNGMMDDLAWFGLQVDDWSSQREQEQYVHERIIKFNHGPLGVTMNYFSQINPEVTASTTPGYPYAPHFTAEKVILDMKDSVTLLIRGEDLVGEFSLYCYFCELWHLPMPHHVYLPRLKNAEKGELEIFSKTNGTHSIKEFRDAGYSPEAIKSKLKECCLVDPSWEWAIENVKKEPLWQIFSEAR
jgi:glutamyl/glutaminyl-tRNA synthetase